MEQQIKTILNERVTFRQTTFGFVVTETQFQANYLSLFLTKQQWKGHTQQVYRCHVQSQMRTILMDETPIKTLVTFRARRATNNRETMPVEVDQKEWFKHSGLVSRLYHVDEQKIQKTNRAHLIKSWLSGNYLVKTFVLKHLDFPQSRNWHEESCLFSKCLKQKNRTR